MARKRRLLVNPSSDEDEEEKEEEKDFDGRTDRDIAITGTWREWLIRVYLKYLFVVGVLFVDCVGALEIWRSTSGGTGVALSFLFILGMVPLEIWTFFRLWGEGGRWGKDVPE
jgi:hypothetical protein